MTPEDRLYRDMWMRECWKPCRELPREERAAERELRRAQDVHFLGDKAAQKRVRDRA